MGNKPAGYMFYNADFKVFQYCNDTDWIAMNVQGSGSGGCATATMGLQPEGRIFYNADYRVLQGCAGNVWQAMGPIGGLPGDPFAQISAGGGSTCGIKTDGTAWCWGDNGSGELGVGDTANRNNPTQIVEDGPWDEIKTGEAYQGYSCGIKSDGTAWCWGRDSNGKLGNGASGNSTIPMQVTDVGPWKTIDVGGPNQYGYHTCGVKTDDTLWCWGSDGYGQLGNGSGITGDQEDPVQISEAGPWDTIDAGRRHSCGIKSDGTAWCWGSDGNGKLGNGAAGASSVPVQISESGPWKDISTPYPAGYHACGVKTDGTAWCWGSDSSGKLGNGAGITGNQEDPVQVSDAGPWESVSVSDASTCGLKSDGTAWCWGNDGNGRLGNGAPSANQEDPSPVSDAGPWSQISNGKAFACGIKTDGTAWCWGADNYGQLGNGTGISGNQIDPVQISEAGPWDYISAGGYHTCAIKTDNSLWCWGNGALGRLGNNDTADQQAPVEVSGGGAWLSVEADQSHTCAIKTDSTAWCWGDIYVGKLGIGDYDLPVASGVGGNCGIAGNTKPEGQLYYNADHNVMQYCAGAGYVKVGK